MSQTLSPENTSAAEINIFATPSRKRRKVRKGTQSCWECKRRKIRCTYATPIDTSCDGCRSRRTECISQEFDDESKSEARNKFSRNSRRPFVGGADECISVDKCAVGMSDSDLTESTYKSFQGQQKDGSHSTPSTAPNTTLAYPQINDLDRPNELPDSLLAAWPNQRDLGIILESPISSSVLFHGVVCRPYSELMSQDILSPREMLQPPTRDSHPILITRKLLLLSTFLQGFPVDSDVQIAGLSMDTPSIMETAFRAATRLGTSDDELATSLEGIECIMMESMYLNNAGNLRRAWLANRRAISMAQVLGLHSGISPSAIAIEEETQRRVRPDYMWARLIMSDRYLSLLLGLPHTSLEDEFARPEVLEQCDPVDRMERLQAVVGGFILQRSIKERKNPTFTETIDRMLRDASALAPPRWWLSIPNISAMNGNDAEALGESIRVMSHFTHHHLLLQIHLPYMSSGDEIHDYNKITAANSGRAILTQFVTFRSAFTSTAYCRGIDFIAFIASTVLCIAHLESRRRDKKIHGLHSLKHQRLSDRALLDQTLDIMQGMSIRTGDPVARKVADILRPLLEIEEDSLTGRRYRIFASSEEDKQKGLGYQAEAKETDRALRIQVPHVGTIMIDNHPTEAETDESLLFLETTESTSNSGGEGPSIAHPKSHGINEVLPNIPNWQDVSSQLSISTSSAQNQSAGNAIYYNNNFNTEKIQDSCLQIPGIDANVEEWALQGVDLALFSVLSHDFKDAPASG